MRSILVVLGLLAVAACNNSAAATTGGTATAADCVNKLMSVNPGSGAPEKKLFTSMCDSLTAEQRSCVVSAKAKLHQLRSVSRVQHSAPATWDHA